MNEFQDLSLEMHEQTDLDAFSVECIRISIFDFVKVSQSVPHRETAQLAARLALAFPRFVIYRAGTRLRILPVLLGLPCRIRTRLCQLSDDAMSLGMQVRFSELVEVRD